MCVPLLDILAKRIFQRYLFNYNT